MVIPRIISLVKELFNETISKHSFEGIRNEESNKITNEVSKSPVGTDVDRFSKSPVGTDVDRLIAQFSLKSDVSFVYVKHDILQNVKYLLFVRT